MSLYRTAAMTTASDPDGKTSSWGFHTDLDKSAGWSGGPSTAQNWRRGGGSTARAATGLRMVMPASTPPAASSVAQVITAIRKPAANA